MVMPKCPVETGASSGASFGLADKGHDEQVRRDLPAIARARTARANSYHVIYEADW